MKIKHVSDYAALRKAAYPDVGEQLDAISKMAESLRSQGIELPAETHQWLDQLQAVKASISKGESA